MTPKALRLLLLLAALASCAAMGPPMGPTDKARCPVTGGNITITSITPALKIKNGQKLYFSSASAAATYASDPASYFLAPHEMPLPGPDGVRGLPDMRNQTLHCPFSGEDMVIGMKSPRVMMRNGQHLYFCCYM